MTLLLDRPVEDVANFAMPVTETYTRPIEAGAGNCSKCPCTSYSDARAGNSYCECGHSYGDHW